MKNLKNKKRIKLLKIEKMRDKTKDNKIKRQLKGVILLATALILNFLGVATNVFATTNISSANIYATNDCGSLLTYKGATVKVTYVEYNSNGIHYPAYCMDKTKPGAEKGEYTVSINSAINDVGLWRRIVNGYPYKTLEQLGVNSKEEAFTATKQAIYCYIHGNNPDDYGAIGEAGNRTLQAMKKIIYDAQNSSETKISSTLTINKISSEWEQDNIEKNYVSKVFNVSAGANISNYKIEAENENAQNLGGIKLTDSNNNEKSEFSPNEKFKILIPIKNLTNNGKINLKVTSTVETKPVLYGTAPDSGHQDYALTAATYENGQGETKDDYYKNETKIIIVKKDTETENYIQGVEFELLDKDKNVVYSDLKTDEKGRIEIDNLIPGEYYIRETKEAEGYQRYEQLINVKADLNQEVTVTVNNTKEEKPQIETKTQNSKSISNKVVKKLPVTGM